MTRIAGCGYYSPVLMKPLAYQVLQHLACGEFRSGAMLADGLNVSRGSVWHAVRELERLGLEIYRVRGRGYRLRQPLSLLDAARVMRLLGTRHGPFAVEVAAAADSTNTLALERARAGAPSGTVIAAEWQHAGRGRLGRRWHAAMAGALIFSVVWRSRHGAASLSGLSLAVGLALVRALHKLKAPEAQLKWPNDVVCRGGKLAGILIEMQGDALGPSCAVIGIGLNVRLSSEVHARIDQAAIDLETLCGCMVDRNVALAGILAELASVLEIFERDGFRLLRSEWQRHHAWQDREVAVALPDGRIESGVARGVDRDGALLISRRGAVQRYHSGEVTLRLKPASMNRARA